MARLRECDLKRIAETYEKANDEERQEFARVIVHQLFQLDMKYNRR